MKQAKPFGIMKQFLKEIKDVKKRLAVVEKTIAEDQLTESDWKEIKQARQDIRKGKYVTLEQLKKELASK